VNGTGAPEGTEAQAPRRLKLRDWSRGDALPPADGQTAPSGPRRRRRRKPRPSTETQPNVAEGDVSQNGTSPATPMDPAANGGRPSPEPAPSPPEPAPPEPGS